MIITGCNILLCQYADSLICWLRNHAKKRIPIDKTNERIFDLTPMISEDDIFLFCFVFLLITQAEQASKSVQGLFVITHLLSQIA